jgi:hypothetical protein
MSDTNLSSFIWSVADLLRGDYKQSEYGKVILPFTILRRLDCVLEPTKAAVLAEQAKRKGGGVNPEPFLLRKSGQLFCNTPTRPTPGSTTTRPRSATRSPSTATSTCSSRRARWPKSTPS